MNKKYRLTSKKAFNYTYKKGSSISNKYIVIIFAPTNYSMRIGFSVSKKIGKAVVRNKTKRRLKEIFRHNLDKLSPNFNYIIVARTGIEELDFKSLEQCTLKLISKLNHKS